MPLAYSRRSTQLRRTGSAEWGACTSVGRCRTESGGMQLKPRREVVGSPSALRPAHHALARSACGAVHSQTVGRGRGARAVGGVAVLVGGARFDCLFLGDRLLGRRPGDHDLAAGLRQAAGAGVQRRVEELLLVLQAGRQGRMMGGSRPAAGRQAGGPRLPAQQQG